jgi:glycosyltransferase involved in cell wall biosynthesis
MAIYSSEWAAESVIKHYDVDPSKVKVVPFGANIPGERHVQDIETYHNKKTFTVCRLLFFGIEWQRKGGDIALEVARRLNERGLKTELHIVGCEPDIGLPDFAICHGFISKQTEAGRAAIDQLLSESHFLILPTRAECFGIVLAEASSFGLPSATTNTGGIPSAIGNGKNGQMFELDADPDEYCDYIKGLMESPEQYRQLSLSSFKEYSERLNWTSVGQQLGNLLRAHC